MKTKEASNLSVPNRELEKSINQLRQIFALASRGDFSHNVDIPDEDNGLLEVLIGVQIMVDVIREKISALESANILLQEQITEKNQLLEQLRTEKEHLAESKSKNEAVLASIGDGMIVTDRKGHIVLINDSAQSMLGLKPELVNGKTVARVIPLKYENGQLIPPKERPISRALSTGKKIINDKPVFYTRPNGEMFPIIYTTTPVIQHQKILGAIIVFRDVSREREVDRVKSEFVSLASHQLRTPLTIINWYLERLLSEKAGTLADKQRHYLDEIYRGGRRMASLVQALLNVSRIELGTFVLEAEATDIVKIAKVVLDEFKPLLEERKLKIQENYGKAIPAAFTDPKVLHIILQNLLGNAIKYTAVGGIITIKIARESQKKTRQHGSTQSNVMISISDTGMGIPNDQQDKIFNKLFRADNVKELDTDGNGLGLYIVKSFLDYLGGSVWFESTEGLGTTFYVRVPLTK